jgi:hypothetical protein
VTEPVGDISYRGEIQVRPYRRGTYLGEAYLDSLVEQALGRRYRFGEGWKGYAVVSLRLYAKPPQDDEG